MTGPSRVAALVSLVFMTLGMSPRAPSDGRGRPDECAVRRVTRDELGHAMRQHGDYDVLATTNRGRFTTELLLGLAHKARDERWGVQFYIDPDDWFFSFVETAGIQPDEAPLSSKLGHEHGQRVLVEYRPGRVVRRVRKGPIPELAISVRSWWPEDSNPADRYSLTDTTSVPKLKATSHREITYRVLDFENMILMDQIDGVTGRPLTGVLGALFSVIGEGGLKQSRFVVTDDGLQILRARSKKVISVWATVTVEPDGTATKGVPDDRPDLRPIEDRLMQDIEIEYANYAWDTDDGFCTMDDA
ncbi:MAG: hypothetical protein ACC682_08625 [Gemmatimonadota bacterium]